MWYSRKNIIPVSVFDNLFRLKDPNAQEKEGQRLIAEGLLVPLEVEGQLLGEVPRDPTQDPREIELMIEPLNKYESLAEDLRFLGRTEEAIWYEKAAARLKAMYPDLEAAQQRHTEEILEFTERIYQERKNAGGKSRQEREF